MNEVNFIFLDGEVIPENEAAISPLSRGIFYGDGCFETLRGYASKFLHLELHIKRLFAACDYLGLTFPYSYGELSEILQKLLVENHFLDIDCVIRIQVWRKGKAFSDLQHKDVHILIQASELKHMKDSVKLKTSALVSVPETSLSRRYKLSNFLNYTLSHGEAAEQGCDQALILNQDGFVSETSIANIFWIKNGEFFTPSEKSDMLPGVTRQIILRLLDQKNFPCQAGEFVKKELLSADAVFVSNSIQEITLVSRIDGNRFDVQDKHIRQLIEYFEIYKAEHLL